MIVISREGGTLWRERDDLAVEILERYVYMEEEMERGGHLFLDLIEEQSCKYSIMPKMFNAKGTPIIKHRRQDESLLFLCNIYIIFKLFYIIIITFTYICFIRIGDRPNNG